MQIPEKHHKLLEENFWGVLTTIRHKDGLPSSNPVYYVWDGGKIRISSLRSRVKYQNIEANSVASFCVVSSKDTMNYLEIRGRATLADDPNREFFREQFRRGSGGMEPPEGLDPPDAERIIITIVPEQVSAPRLYGDKLDYLRDKR